MAKSMRVARDVVRIPTGIANAYLVGTSRMWVLVDAGTPGNYRKIRSVAEETFGNGSRPEAIILTHGHFDHAGSAAELSDFWEAPIYARRLEIPFVTGKSKYPPPDPTVGGFMSFMIRFVPNKAYDLGGRVRELTGTAEPPGMLGWQIIDTPGHTSGHVSFFRAADGALIAGDAFTTVNQDSFIDYVTQKQGVWRPPAYYTSNWQQAHDSVRRLAELDPNVLAAGHGIPIVGREGARQLRELARNFPVPEHGRYVPEPALSDERGITHLPPRPSDPVGVGLKIGAATAGAAAVGWAVKKARNAA